MMRFPFHVPHFPYSEPIVQLEITGPVAASRSPLALIAAAFEHGTAEIAKDPELAAPLNELVTTLQQLGTVSVDSAFGEPIPNLEKILTAEQKIARARLLHVRFEPGRNLRRIAMALRGLSIVKRADPLPGDAPPGIPDDPLVGISDRDSRKQWYLFRCRALRAWDLATGRNVVIADVDWGCRITHQDLTNIEPQKAYNSHDGSHEVGNGKHVSHGTSVLGIAGGVRNHLGIVGFAPDAKLWPIQAVAPVDHGRRPPGSAWARGIDYVLASSDTRRKVLMIENQSPRGRNIEQEYALNQAIQDGIAHGLIIVVAAGNGAADVRLDDSNKAIPKTGSILVGATDFHPRFNIRSCFSNFGERLTVSAPGDSRHDVTCTSKSDSAYRVHFGGTSGATPKVAGVCAMMLEADPSLSHQDVKSILKMTGSEVLAPPNKPAGVFLDAYAAVRMATYQSQRARSTAAVNAL
jgi:subtilisin family serine protease